VAFRQSEQPRLPFDLPRREFSCFRLLLAKGTPFSEEETAPPNWPATCSAPRSGTVMPMASKALPLGWSSSEPMPCWCSFTASTSWRKGRNLRHRAPMALGAGSPWAADRRRVCGVGWYGWG